MSQHTIQSASDLHLEFFKNYSALKASPLIPKGEILILAGDVVPFIMIDKYIDFFQILKRSLFTDILDTWKP